MRGIKFRTWNKLANRWATHEEQLCEIPVSATVRSPSILTCGCDDFEINSFTGLHDKSGKEIYEGDIVKAWSQGSCGIFQIKWREDGGGSPMWLLYPAWQNGEMWGISASREQDGKCYDRGLEVIGNIWKNPDLLGCA